MPLQFEQTALPGLVRITPFVFPDDRGAYQKHYERDAYADAGINCVFTESSDLYSKKGALRGLHYQEEESQAKLIRVLSGAIFDVALDLRQNSPTFGQYHAELLKAGENKALFIPADFAHGFIALEENTLFSYLCSGRYVPKACGGIRWDDSDLNIPWPLKEYGIDHVIATEKDLNWPTLREYCETKGIIKGWEQP